MRIFVLCAGKGKYSGRILAHQLKVRLKGSVIVDFGSAEDLYDARCREEFVYSYVLNTGSVDKFIAGCRVLNEVPMTNMVRNRKIFLMKMRQRNVPVPEFKLRAASVNDSLLPMVGRVNFSEVKDDFWGCFTIGQIFAAEREGATHFVKRVPNSREFKVHVVAPRVDTHNSLPKEYQVVKLSERVTASKENQEINPANKKLWGGYYFGKMLHEDAPLEAALRVTAQHALKESMLHWGSVSLIVGNDGVPLVFKMNTHLDLKEDQTNTMVKMSNAICKMLGKNPKPLTRRRPGSYG
jgi:hypothetical protein